MENMSENAESKITYVAFGVKGSMFAIPINETLGIIKLTQELPQTILPYAPDYVKCILEVDDGLLITVINMPGADGDMQASGDLIVVLDCEQHIGISADEVYLVTISANEIMEDIITGTRAFMRGGKTYSILDDCQLNKYMGI